MKILNKTRYQHIKALLFEDVDDTQRDSPWQIWYIFIDSGRYTFALEIAANIGGPVKFNWLVLNSISDSCNKI